MTSRLLLGFAALLGACAPAATQSEAQPTSPAALNASARSPATNAIAPPGAQSPGAPFTIKPGLFDASEPDALGLSRASGTETITIFRATEASDHFGNGVVLIEFKGSLYAQWQSSATDEDSADTWTAYSRSRDGKTWSAPTPLVPRSKELWRTSGGFLVAGDTLVAYLNVWKPDTSPRGGHTEYVTSTDGLSWSTPKPLTMADGSVLNGIFEQDPRALPGGRILGAAHFQPGLVVAPTYTDDPTGTAGWVRAPFVSLSPVAATTREMEPSFYQRADGAAVMVFRDQESSFRKLAATSFDRGATWTTPVLTDMPDSRSKQSAGNLPDGTAYFVSNPVGEKRRAPLAITLSRDGQIFDRAFVLRKGGSELPPRRWEGKAKTLGYSYPKSMVANGYLYVGYSTNKEDIELTRVPLASLAY